MGEERNDSTGASRGKAVIENKETLKSNNLIWNCDMELTSLIFKETHLKQQICMCISRGGGSAAVMEMWGKEVAL